MGRESAAVVAAIPILRRSCQCDKKFSKDYKNGLLGSGRARRQGEPLAGGGAQINAGKDGRHLGRSDFDMVRLGLGEAEDSALEPLVPEGSLVVPVEDLEAIAAPIAKDKEMPGEGVHADGRGREGSEAVEFLAEIRRPTAKKMRTVGGKLITADPPECRGLDEGSRMKPDGTRTTRPSLKTSSSAVAGAKHDRQPWRSSIQDGYVPGESRGSGTSLVQGPCRATAFRGAGGRKSVAEELQHQLRRN